MCDPGITQSIFGFTLHLSLVDLLSAADVAIVAAVGFVIAAAIANNSFFGAPGSPALMIAAGVSSLAAIALLGEARSAAEAFFQCAGSPPACLGAFNNLMNALAGLIAVLGIQSTACFATAGIAWIPWAGAAPMYVILGSFISQLALIPSATLFANDFINCIQNLATSHSGAALTIGGVVAVVALGAGILVTTRKRYVPRDEKPLN